MPSLSRRKIALLFGVENRGTARLAAKLLCLSIIIIIINRVRSLGQRLNAQYKVLQKLNRKTNSVLNN